MTNSMRFRKLKVFSSYKSADDRQPLVEGMENSSATASTGNIGTPTRSTFLAIPKSTKKSRKTSMGIVKKTKNRYT